jgi:hypothetical protein
LITSLSFKLLDRSFALTLFFLRNLVEFSLPVSLCLHLPSFLKVTRIGVNMRISFDPRSLVLLKRGRPLEVLLLSSVKALAT